MVSLSVPPDEEFCTLDARLLSELKRLVREHRIVIDPKDSDFDALDEAIRNNREGLSGPERHRYWEVAEEAWHVHSDLTRSGGLVGEPPFVTELVRNRALNLIQNVSSFADEPAPVRLPEEPFSRLVMYLLPLLVAPAGLALLLYTPATETSILAGVAVTNIGFLGGVWSWRVRFQKWPGARGLWTFAAIYVGGLTLVEILAILGLIRTP